MVRKSVVMVAVLVATSTAMSAQESAKALFMDSTTGVSVGSSSEAKLASTRTQTPSRVRTQGAAPSGPSVTGLGYWVELKTDSGQLIRTNSSRVFHTGERIRLHLTSNVDGQLTILQSQDGGPYTKLFPKSAGSSGRVDRLETNVFPSGDHWFRFDEHPGEIHLMVMVQAENAGSSPGTAQSTTTAETTQHPASDQQLEAKLRANVDKLRGSKALVVEDDTSSEAEQTSYAVVDTRRDTSVPSGFAAIEIKLNHR